MSTTRSDIETEIAATRFREQAEPAYRAVFNAPPPGHLPGESVGNYRVRLLEPMAKLSDAYKGATADKLARMGAAGALDVVEGQVYHDAIAYSERPSGPLREVQSSPDRAGRIISRFYGDPEGCWGNFKLPVRYVRGFNTRGGR